MSRHALALASLPFLSLACGDDPSPADTSPQDAADDAIDDTTPDASPDTAGADTATPRHCQSWNAARSPFFGDLHVHTRLSLDANLQGTRLGPADAYRFARGDEVGLQPHRPDGTPLRTLRLDRPLDFAAVTDHAEFLGTVNVCSTPGAPATTTPSA